MVGSNRLPSLYYDAEKTGNAENLEYVAHNTDVQSDYIRHFPDPERHSFLGSYFCR
ncbi:unnamed protein product, partial [marine sediment metagenome]